MLVVNIWERVLESVGGRSASAVQTPGPGVETAGLTHLAGYRRGKQESVFLMDFKTVRFFFPSGFLSRSS